MKSWALRMSSASSSAGRVSQVWTCVIGRLSRATDCGSKTHTGSSAARTSRVPSTMPRLFEVTRAAPGAAGIARDVLLPVRGPQISMCMSSQEP